MTSDIVSTSLDYYDEEVYDDTVITCDAVSDSEMSNNCSERKGDAVTDITDDMVVPGDGSKYV